jgi:hypothetical protein
MNKRKSICKSVGKIIIEDQDEKFQQKIKKHSSNKSIKLKELSTKLKEVAF